MDGIKQASVGTAGRHLVAAGKLVYVRDVGDWRSIPLRKQDQPARFKVSDTGEQARDCIDARILETADRQKGAMRT